MAIIAEELYSLLVPLHSSRLIVPRTCVAEVIRYAPIAKEGQSSSWLRGFVKWNNAEIPVVSFEALSDENIPAASGRTRVVVFHSIRETKNLPAYGILSEGFPQMVKVNREVVVLDDTYRVKSGTPVICQISMLKDSALIPDLETVEQRILAELQSSELAGA